jgi:hypothetical protein
MGESFLSHGPGLTAILAMAYFHALWLEKRRAAFAFLSGLFAALMVLIRPVTALAVLIVFLIHGQVAFKGSFQKRILAFSLFLAALALAGGFMLLYNKAQTGDPLLFPYQKYAELYTPYDRFGLENAGQGALNTVFNLSRLNHWLFGYAPSLLVPAVLFFLGAVASWELLFLGAFVVLAGAYVFHWFWGTPYYGPLYFYECTAFLILLSARCFVLASERLSTVFTPDRGALYLTLMCVILFATIPSLSDQVEDVAIRIQELWMPMEGIIQAPVEEGAFVIMMDGPTGFRTRYMGAAPEWMTGGIRILSGAEGDPSELKALNPDNTIYLYTKDGLVEQ